jgi:hypothetical protein
VTFGYWEHINPSTYPAIMKMEFKNMCLNYQPSLRQILLSSDLSLVLYDLIDIQEMSCRKVFRLQASIWAVKLRILFGGKVSNVCGN